MAVSAEVYVHSLSFVRSSGNYKYKHIKKETNNKFYISVLIRNYRFDSILDKFFCYFDFDKGEEMSISAIIIKEIRQDKTEI